MEAEETIERIKHLEEWGKKQAIQAELDSGEILRKAREKATLLVENFEKTREADLQQELADAEKEAKKVSQKIISKAEDEADAIKKKAAAKITETTNKAFENFKKQLTP